MLCANLAFLCKEVMRFALHMTSAAENCRVGKLSGILKRHDEPIFSYTANS